MDEKSRELFQRIILQSGIKIEEDYMQLSEFDNVILAGKEDVSSFSGFSFLILQKDLAGKTVFRGIAEEFQNASAIFVLRATLNMNLVAG